MTYEGAYIRPCAAFPNGVMLAEWQADRLLERGLIVPASPDAENRNPLDYEAVYDTWDDDDVYRASRKIMEVIRQFPA